MSNHDDRRTPPDPERSGTTPDPSASEGPSSEATPAAGAGSPGSAVPPGGSSTPKEPAKKRLPSRLGSRTLLLSIVVLVTMGATLGVTALLVTIFEHKQEARTPFVRVAEIDETTTDPAPWGLNWPHHFHEYKLTAGDRFRGGSSALSESKLEQDPWLQRLYAGYAFSIDYREARGHAYMLYDQVVTERVNKRPQAGACLHCHASTTVLYRKVGREALGKPSSPEVLAEEFDKEALIRGFQELSSRPYYEVLSLLSQVPDGTPKGAPPVFPSPPVGGFDPQQPTKGEFHMEEVHPVSCIDCHDPKTMAVRVTRPGFMLGIAALAAGEAPVPHLPSIERWRRGSRSEPYDPNAEASRQEMRSFVCGQCHVEYYCANKMTLTFPWAYGLAVEDIERFWDETRFPDGSQFYDWKHGETGAMAYKAQHPEFELWSQGIHARAGVSCADCHMPYERVGAMKMSSHDVRSPVESLNASCQGCHRVDERELSARIAAIQTRTEALLETAAAAMTDMLDAIREAKAAGAPPEELERCYELQRKAMFRIDYISSENSRGFHADQEAARILAQSIDYSRQAQALALRLRAPAAPDTSEVPSEPVYGVSDREGPGAPPGPSPAGSVAPPAVPPTSSVPAPGAAPETQPKPGATAQGAREPGRQAPGASPSSANPGGPPSPGTSAFPAAPSPRTPTP